MIGESRVQRISEDINRFNEIADEYETIGEQELLFKLQKDFPRFYELCGEQIIARRKANAEMRGE